MTYERFVKQLDGCAYHSGGDNCTCACEAMWLYRASQGAISTTACHVRELTGDRTAGTNLEQMQTVSAHYGITGGALYRPAKASKVQALVTSGRFGAIWQLDYSPIANTRWDCFDGNFRGNHAVYVSKGTASLAHYGDPGADGRRSSIPKGYQDIPWTTLIRAAGYLDLGGGHTLNQEFGGGYVYAYLTPADPITPTTKYRVIISGYVKLYFAPNGQPDGAVTRATYICTRGKINGLWWYKIISKADGGKTLNAGKWFKPNRYVEAHPV